MTQQPDDPFTPSDATILRPRPGRRSSAAPEPGRSAAPPLSGSYRAPPPPPPPHGVTLGPSSDGGGRGSGLAAFMSGGINPLLQGAVPLMVLAGRLRGQIANADVDNLRIQAAQEVRAFEERARVAAVPDEDVLAARYALCTVIDEAVLNTPWGAQSGWAGQSLLVTFHREASGGEKFFHIVDRVMNEPRRYLALIELLYVCLAFGFEGRYRLDDRGPIRLNEIRQDLYRCIQGLRGGAETDLSPNWKGVEDKRHVVVRTVPLWVVAVACGTLLLGAFIVFSARLSARTDPVNALLAGVGLEPLYSPAPAFVEPQAVGLRELLAEQIQRGLVSVEEEQNGRTVVTITVSDLFTSGSATVNPAYAGLISEIGSAAEKVSGRYMVTGHTDDVPVRSFQFMDNYNLSRERALQVANLLKQQIQDAGRVDFAGMGASEPRYTPENLPENRARNRRVEIIHRRDG